MFEEGNTDMAKISDNAERHADAATGRARQPAGRASAEDIERLRFELTRNAVYHDQLSRRLGLWNRFTMLATIVFGSSAAVGLVSGDPMLGQALGLSVAVIGAVQLVWDFSGRAAEHLALRGRYYDLLAQVEGGGDAGDIASAMALLYADEPPISNRDNEAAHDQAGQSVYGDDFIRARA